MSAAARALRLVEKLERAKAWARGERASRRELAAVVLEQRAEIARLTAPVDVEAEVEQVASADAGVFWVDLDPAEKRERMAKYRPLVERCARLQREVEDLTRRLSATRDRVEATAREAFAAERERDTARAEIARLKSAPGEALCSCGSGKSRSVCDGRPAAVESPAPAAWAEEEADAIVEQRMSQLIMIIGTGRFERLDATTKDAIKLWIRDCLHPEPVPGKLCGCNGPARLNIFGHHVAGATGCDRASCRDIPAEARAGANVADVARKLAANLANGLGVAHEVRHPSGLVERVEPERLCVAALVTDPADRVLLVRHRKRAWELPGGGVEPGEKPEQAINREVIEEAGLVMSRIFMPDVVHLEGTPKPGALYRSRICVFPARAEGTPKAGGDALDARWWTARQVERLAQHGVLSDLATRAVLVRWAEEHRNPRPAAPRQGDEVPDLILGEFNGEPVKARLL